MVVGIDIDKIDVLLLRLSHLCQFTRIHLHALQFKSLTFQADENENDLSKI